MPVRLCFQPDFNEFAKTFSYFQNFLPVDKKLRVKLFILRFGFSAAFVQLTFLLLVSRVNIPLNPSRAIVAGSGTSTM